MLGLAGVGGEAFAMLGTGCSFGDELRGQCIPGAMERIENSLSVDSRTRNLRPYEAAGVSARQDNESMAMTEAPVHRSDGDGLGIASCSPSPSPWKNLGLETVETGRSTAWGSGQPWTT